MFRQKEKHLKIFSSLSVFPLIVAVLVLSYCPLRRAIQGLFKGSHQTAQTDTRHGKPLTLKVCPGIIDPDPKLALPEPEFKRLPGEHIIIDLTVFSSFRPSPVLEVGIASHDQVCLNFFNTVPIYLWNSVFLI
jgi:hypothetical protein